MLGMDKIAPQIAPATPSKPRYRVANWRDYDRALVARGSITLWIDDAVLAGWRATGGKGRRYSDAAILCDRVPPSGVAGREDRRDVRFGPA
jgi:hypothetical protein